MALPERVPPQNIEAEQAVLGAMMIKKEAIVEAQEILQPEDFYREAHRRVYDAMLKLAENDEAVDLVTLTAPTTPTPIFLRARARRHENCTAWCRWWLPPRCRCLSTARAAQARNM